jgi:acetate---CoA ligase (ADP-forming) subunit beta
MKLMDYTKTKHLLKEFKIPLPVEKLIQTAEEGKAFARSHGYPIAMKIISKDIIHKSDIGCVKANIKDDKELSQAFKDIVYNAHHFYPNAVLDGMLIQKQSSGYEIIIGMKHDNVFGPVIMFGLGGVFVEVMKDVSFQIAPVTKTEAKEMIEKIKGYKILQGIRGAKPANIDALADIIVNLSKLAKKNKYIAEIDFNPVFVDNKKATVVDARVMLND